MVETSKGWDSFVSTAEDICRGALKKDEGKYEKNQNEGERKENMMKEREKLRKWDAGWGNQTRVQIMGYSGGDLVEWKVENKQSRVQGRGARICWTKGTYGR